MLKCSWLFLFEALTSLSVEIPFPMVKPPVMEESLTLCPVSLLTCWRHPASCLLLDVLEMPGDGGRQFRFQIPPTPMLVIVFWNLA